MGVVRGVVAWWCEFGVAITRAYAARLCARTFRAFLAVCSDLDLLAVPPCAPRPSPCYCQIMPGVYVTERGPLSQLVDFLHDSLSSTGKLLVEAGHASLGHFIVSEIELHMRSRVAAAMRHAGAHAEGAHGEDAAAAGATAVRPSAAALVETLARSLPTFNDRHEYKGRTVYLLKKAQIAVGELYRLLKDKDSRFDFYDADRLTVYTDNVRPRLLTCTCGTQAS